MSSLRIEAIPCLRDNYAYLLSDPAGDAWVVDPSEFAPVDAALAQRGLTLRGILATHHHHDHVGGIAAVAGHSSDRGRIPCQSVFVAAPSERFVPTEIAIGGRSMLAMWIPGHTLGAIAWYLPPGPGMPDGDVFTGDTLFAAGCGRLFEGSAAQMHMSLRGLTSLPSTTRLWFGHEYTAANLRFAASVDPENAAILDRQRRIAELSSATTTIRTTPTTVAEEQATNPFVRAANAEVLATIRAAKDSFAG
ncbi:UNVERIFIED_CONTAM: hypothetical protein GTU68_052899 [Idotea baltica]|nr:hypothetical protein [Idotea baltica]